MIFPIRMTWDQIAIQPFAADAFGWDPSMIDPDDDDTTLASTIAQYSEAFTSSKKLAIYLGQIGYELTPGPDGEPFIGIAVRNEQALRTANALFDQIGFEYDDIDAVQVPDTRYHPEGTATPTWAMFELGGDDDVDYCSSQPSCLTDLLLRLIDLRNAA